MPVMLHTYDLKESDQHANPFRQGNPSERCAVVLALIPDKRRAMKTTESKTNGEKKNTDLAMRKKCHGEASGTVPTKNAATQS